MAAPLFTLTVREVLLFHSIDRSVFDRLLRLGCPWDYAQRVTALWMCLERLGFDDLLAEILQAAPDDIVRLYLKEADVILHAIRPDVPPPQSDLALILLPLTSSKVSPRRNRDLRFFYANRDVVAQGIDEVMGGVGRVVFDDALWALTFADPKNPKLAQNFDRGPTPIPENDRTMLVMFGGGPAALTAQQIHHFFAVGWGLECVDRVVVEAATPTVRILYGRVVFKNAKYFEFVLKGQQQAEFVIYERLLLGVRPTNNRNAFASLGTARARTPPPIDARRTVSPEGQK